MSHNHTLRTVLLPKIALLVTGCGREPSLPPSLFSTILLGLMLLSYPLLLLTFFFGYAFYLLPLLFFDLFDRFPIGLCLVVIFTRFYQIDGRSMSQTIAITEQLQCGRIGLGSLLQITEGLRINRPLPFRQCQLDILV